MPDETSPHPRRQYRARPQSEHDAEIRRQDPPTDAERALAQVADWGPAQDWADWAPKGNHEHDFLEYVLDQLHPLGLVLPRAMFGGHGLYRDGVFFGIVAGGRLYFKTDERTCRRYVERGSEPFHANMKQTLWSYYEVPAAILDDPSELASWAEEAVDIQRRSIHKG